MSKDDGVPEEHAKFKRKKIDEKRVIEGCEECSEFTQHIELANESRRLYKVDKEKEVAENEVVVSTDMRKVVCCRDYRD